jgi:hypothetical protein
MQNGVIENQVQQDINGDGSRTLLAASNDWAKHNTLFTNLNFAFQVTSGFGNHAGSTLALKDGFSRQMFLASRNSAHTAIAP